MRLTCPNCGAQYEVPDEVIPEDGRDVQCSNCETTWFQPKHPDQTAPTKDAPGAKDTRSQTAAPEPDVVEQASATQAQPEPTPAPEPEITQEPEVAPKPEAASEPETPPATGKIDPAVASILKEEAEREADLRAQEGGGLETQPDLALDAPPKPDPERAVKDLTAMETAKDAGQKDALPDVEAINSSLRSDDSLASEDEPAPRKSGSGFMRGFALMLIVGVILLLVYGNAQQISEAVPQAEPILNPYVSLVDQARLWLEAQTSGTSQN
ncbi:zinc-ribbon domain-containing protein [Ruegeria profundi]|uniref:zinc-ribbon domain-containing protein n=1 Tax=Ruegeria profundi TaxID=1685378 RepID=UPI001CD81699|nr:zinc-ribbon domain-containing protein [Ruegeria profundi]MCA0929915.1 zinc-ribbon domain-containing protein [Ruegeria profundi]